MAELASTDALIIASGAAQEATEWVLKVGQVVGQVRSDDPWILSVEEMGHIADFVQYFDDRVEEMSDYVETAREVLRGAGMKNSIFNGPVERVSS